MRPYYASTQTSKPEYQNNDIKNYFEVSKNRLVSVPESPLVTNLVFGITKD